MVNRVGVRTCSTGQSGISTSGWEAVGNSTLTEDSFSTTVMWFDCEDEVSQKFEILLYLGYGMSFQCLCIKGLFLRPWCYFYVVEP